MSWLKFRLRAQVARRLVDEGRKADQGPDHRELLDALERELPKVDKAGAYQRPARSFVGVRERPSRRRDQSSTGEVREAVWLRSEGKCECGCGRRISWSTFEMDHFLGRGKWPESPETCWALAKECHDAKHAGTPSRLRWLWLFFLHLQDHGFGFSETGNKVWGQIQGEQLIEKAEAIRARTGGTPP